MSIKGNDFSKLETSFLNEVKFLEAIPSWRENFQEITLLQTCNRIEIYYVNDCFVPPSFFWKNHQDFHIQIFRQHLAVEHLFKVAGGLESMALGETQILGQVKKAYDKFFTLGLTGPVLNRLFQKCFHTAKLLRTQTKFYEKPISLVSLTDDQILENSSVLIFGAGEMIQSLVSSLLRKKLKNICFINRDVNKAKTLSEKFPGISSYRSLEGIYDLSKFDFVISCVGSESYILHEENTLSNHKTTIIDLGMPRNISPSLGLQPNINLITLENLKVIADTNLEHRKSEITKINEILSAQISFFVKRLHEKNCYSPARHKTKLTSTLAG